MVVSSLSRLVSPPFRRLFGVSLVVPSLSCPAYSLVPAHFPLSSSHGRLPQNFQTSSAAFPAKFCPRCGDRFCQGQTRTRTLSGVKGRAPGATPNGGDIVIPDGSLFPGNLDPLGGEAASPSDSERGPYLHLTSLIIFLPHHHRHPSALGVISRSFGDRQCCASRATSCVAGVPSSGLVLSPQTPTLGYPY